MIPPFNEQTGLLPPGIHEATWAEFVARYGYTTHRLILLAGLKAGLDALRDAGCQRAYIDGSFVTAKTTPGDFDTCWEAVGVRAALLHPALRTFANLRAAQKAAFSGEFFPAEAVADVAGTRFIDFFQLTAGGSKKGVVAINLGGLP